VDLLNRSSFTGLGLVFKTWDGTNFGHRLVGSPIFTSRQIRRVAHRQFPYPELDQKGIEQIP